MPPSNVSPFPERNGKLLIMLLLVPSVGPPLSVEVYIPRRRVHEQRKFHVHRGKIDYSIYK